MQAHRHNVGRGKICKQTPSDIAIATKNCARKCMSGPLLQKPKKKFRFLAQIKRKKLRVTHAKKSLGRQYPF